MNVKGVLSHWAQVAAERIYTHKERISPSPQFSEQRDQLSKTCFVAHRGAHSTSHLDSAPENTLAAFRNALQSTAGYPVRVGLEFDVRWTRDLVPVICHDPSTQRVFHTPHVVQQLSFAELRACCPQIPSLEEVLHEFGKKAHLMIELKRETWLDLDRQKEILHSLLSTLNPTEDYHFLSLHPEVYEDFSNFENPVYVLVAELNFNRLSRVCLEKNWGGLTGHYALFNSALIETHRKAGQKLGTGMLNTPQLIKRELSRQMDWLFIDRFAATQQALDSMDIPTNGKLPISIL